MNPKGPRILDVKRGNTMENLGMCTKNRVDIPARFTTEASPLYTYSDPVISYYIVIDKHSTDQINGTA
jgi:hypothetical protein